MGEPRPDVARADATDGAQQSDPRFGPAVVAIDAANAEDPNEIRVRDVRGPKELLHGRMAAEWVARLDPDADVVQLLAARAHHFRRWTSPRSDHPEGRAGYLRWRAAAARRHAKEVAALLAAHGYHPDEIARVAAVIRKDGRTRDPKVQTHEDALCLVFLETQLADVVERLGEERSRSVLARTLRKMSPAGIAAALALDPTTPGLDLVVAAVEGLPGSRTEPAAAATTPSPEDGGAVTDPPR